MISKALKHKNKVLANLAVLEGSTQPLPIKETVKGDDMEVVLHSLETDLEKLSDLTSVSDKVERKALLIPAYLPHVERYIESGARYQNPVLVWVAIWAFDIEDMETAIRLAKVAIEQQQVITHRNFKRDLTTFFIESVADWADNQFKKQDSASPYIEEVIALYESKKWVCGNTIALSKLYRNAGFLSEARALVYENAGASEEAKKEFNDALRYWQKAMEENPEKGGVKTRINKLAKKLGTAPQPSSSSGAD